LPGGPGTISARPAPAPSGTPQPADPAASDGACLASLRGAYGDKINAVPGSKPLPSDPQCRVVDPVIVEAMSFEGAAIGFSPPVTLSCAMAGEVGRWLKTSVRPLTRGYFGGELSKLEVGGGQECRRRNRAATGLVSEHATGGALDIFAFEAATQPPTRVSVENPDAPMKRDYLLALRQSACGAFNTSLGPGSDPAHATHIHVDIQVRRSNASKFCQ
jgi:hypothetical protein